MYETRIAADRFTVTAAEGIPPEVDALAGCNLSGHGFLRAAWYGAGRIKGARTLLVRRGAGGDVIAAIPTIALGPAILGARKVPGSYWPLRSPLVAPGCSPFDLAQALEHPASRGLGPVWRVGPARVDDPAIALLIDAAQIAGWSVISRPAGTSWVIDLDAARAVGFPRASTAKRLGTYWRKLESIGTPRWHYVRGSGWNGSVLEDLGQIEAQSWIGRTTDGSGAKFMTSAQRAAWGDVLRDPVLAEKLSATLLLLDDRPVAFSFDLDDGPVQYGIAGSYVEDLKRLNIGKLANYRAMEDAVADGKNIMDMGAGDTGYKREMGAVEGYKLADLLFVRSRTGARVLARAWGKILPRRPLAAIGPHRLPHD